MATSGSHPYTGKCGIIILGNAGAGKSFLCNVLLDSVKFDSNFSAKPVTLTTENATITVNEVDLQIFNIPGLIERNQERIDQNKKEIINAFETPEKSIVIYVWSHQEGRVQENDIIAFKALYDAYQFPLGSLIYVINNIAADENTHKFQSEFLTEIKEGLLEEENLTVDPKDALFIKKIDFKDTIQRAAEREKLLKSISEHHPAIQSRKADIILQKDQLKKLREDIKRHQQAAEADHEYYARKIKMMSEAIIAEAEQDRGNYERIRVPPDPTTLVIAASAGAVAGGVSGAVHGYGKGFNAVFDHISDFAKDRDIPLPVRVVGTPLAAIGGAVVAPVAGVAGAVVGAAEGIADGVKGVFGRLF